MASAVPWSRGAAGQGEVVPGGLGTGQAGGRDIPVLRNGLSPHIPPAGVRSSCVSAFSGSGSTLSRITPYKQAALISDGGSCQMLPGQRPEPSRPPGQRTLPCPPATTGPTAPADRTGEHETWLHPPHLRVDVLGSGGHPGSWGDPPVGAACAACPRAQRSHLRLSERHGGRRPRAQGGGRSF